MSEQAAHPSVPYGRGDSAVGGPPWRGDRDSGWRLEEASLEAGAKDKDVSGGELRSSIVVLVLWRFSSDVGKSGELTANHGLDTAAEAEPWRRAHATADQLAGSGKEMENL